MNKYIRWFIDNILCWVVEVSLVGVTFAIGFLLWGDLLFRHFNRVCSIIIFVVIGLMLFSLWKYMEAYGTEEMKRARRNATFASAFSMILTYMWGVNLLTGTVGEDVRKFLPENAILGRTALLVILIVVPIFFLGGGGMALVAEWPSTAGKK